MTGGKSIAVHCKSKLKPTTQPNPFYTEFTARYSDFGAFVQITNNSGPKRHLCGTPYSTQHYCERYLKVSFFFSEMAICLLGNGPIILCHNPALQVLLRGRSKNGRDLACHHRFSQQAYLWTHYSGDTGWDDTEN